MAKRTAVFSEEAGRRIKRAVLIVERQPLDGLSAGHTPRAPVTPNAVALTTSTITPRSGTTSAPVWGTGTAQVYRTQGSSDVLADVVTVKNTQATTIPSGVIVQLKWMNGFYFIDVSPC